jgi:ABC-type transporter Mla MlaB component
MERLRSVMMSKPMPWHLGWGALERIERDAVPLLEGLFGGLCDEAAVLRFDGEASLPLALRALTPSGGRGADAMSWHLRLNALRAMGLQDDFELAALEYCFAFGSAPTPWVDAQCQIQMSGAGHDALQPAPDTAYQMVAPEAGEGVSQLVLQGEVLGDATQALAMLDSTPAAGKYVLIACRDLVRVDFAAAGSILNWVAMRQAEGKQVQFQNVHRLVAAFFNVIGINEHAKILPRPI